MSHYKMRGYVLITVLVFLQLLSCLGLYELASVSTTLRESQRYWSHELEVLKATDILTKLETNVLSGNLTCLVPNISSSELAKKPETWWEQKTCYQSHSQAHYYMVESLGDDPCGIMSKNQSNQVITAHYYRITLLMIIDKIKGAKLILQSTLAKLGSDTLSCTEQMHRVILGRQMLRKLS